MYHLKLALFRLLLCTFSVALRGRFGWHVWRTRGGWEWVVDVCCDTQNTWRYWHRHLSDLRGGITASKGHRAGLELSGGAMTTLRVCLLFHWRECGLYNGRFRSVTIVI